MKMLFLWLCFIFCAISQKIISPTTNNQQPINLNEQNTLPRAFDVIIPLGDMCQTAFQLSYLGLKQENYGFEWLITESAASIAALIINRFEGFLDTKDLTLINNDSHNTKKYGHAEYILNARYGIRMVHDFPCNASFMAKYKNIFAKYERRINRFLTTLTEAEKNNKSVLFVRKCATKNDAALITFAILYHWRKLDFTLLVIDETEEIKAPWQIKHVINHYLKGSAATVEKGGQLGDKDAWKELFDTIIDPIQQVFNNKGCYSWPE